MPKRKSKTYTRADIAEELSIRFKISRRDARDIVGFTMESMRLALENGLRVELRRFGTFNLKTRKPKVVRNPFFPERGSYTLPAQTVVAFHACDELAENVKKI